MEEGYPVKQEQGRKISKTVSNTVENSYFDKFKIMSLKYFCNGIFLYEKDLIHDGNISFFLKKG